MSAQTTSSSRAFFLELVLDLVIFALCAAICLQVFTQAHLESMRSGALSQLGIEAQEIAETFKSGATDPATLAQLTGSVNANGMQVDAVQIDGVRAGDTLIWYYDRDCQPVTSAAQSHFSLICTIDDSQAVKQARILLAEDSTELFVFEVSRYVPLAGTATGATAGTSAGAVVDAGVGGADAVAGGGVGP